jgi:aminoglycoside/choline kinase family phosphotransferase
VARLAGADTARFVAAAHWLRAHGLAAPDIYAADPAQGFVILEDLGDALFAEVLADGGNEKQLYEHAVEVLAKIHTQDAPSALSPGKPLFDFDLTALTAETDLLIVWFLPLALGRKPAAEETGVHRRLWRAALSGLARPARVRAP